MATADDRALAAYEDVIAVEHHAPGMVHVVTVSDEYIVDARHETCECPDYEYNLDGEGRCKHLYAALDATDQLPIGGIEMVETLDQRAATDGGTLHEGSAVWTERAKDLADADECEMCGDDLACFEHFEMEDDA